MPVLNRIAAYAEEMKAWRRHLHAHPELAFDICERWVPGASEERQWLIRHAVRWVETRPPEA